MTSLLNDHLISTSEASSISGCHADYIARLARAKKISGRRIGRNWFVDRQSLLAFIEEQGGRKSDYARALAHARAKEFEAHQAPVARVIRAVEKPVVRLTARASEPEFDIPGASMSSHFMAIAAAFLVVGAGAIMAQSSVIPQAAERVALVATQASIGFAVAFGEVPSRLNSDMNAATSHVATVVDRVASGEASTTHAIAPTIAIDLSALPAPAVATIDVRAHRVPMPVVPADEQVLTVEELKTSAVAAVGTFASPTRAIGAAHDAYVALGTAGYRAIVESLLAYRALLAHAGDRALALGSVTRDTIAASPRMIASMNLALGELAVGASRAAIRADVSLAYGTAAAAPATARATVALIGNTGDAIELATARLAYGAPERIAQAVFDTEVAIARPIVALNEELEGAYIAAVYHTGYATESTASGALALADRAAQALPGQVRPSEMLASAGAAARDAYLGALGKSAVALESLTRSSGLAAALSAGEQVALATYESINGFFSTTSRAIASLFGSTSSVTSSPLVPVTAANSPRVAVAPVASSTPRAAAPARAPAPIINSYPSYVTTVNGVSQSYVDSAVMNMRNGILATVSGMVQPIATQTVINQNTIQQVNMIQRLGGLIVDNGVFNGGTFDKGNITNGIAVTSANGTFTNLAAGATTLATTTVSGDLTLSGILTANTKAVAPYFVATASNATSTFAGAVGIGTTSPAGLLHLASTAQRNILVADGTAGRVYFGTSTNPFMRVDEIGGGGMVSIAASGAMEGLSIIGSTWPNSALSFSGIDYQGLNYRDRGALYYEAAQGGQYGSLVLTTSRTDIPLQLQSNGGNVGIGTTSPDALLALQQTVNGVPFISAYRATDAAPAGDFINYKTKSGTTLFRVDNSGNLMAGGIINTGSQTITSVTSPQFRVQYDASHEITTSVSSTGTTTLGVTNGLVFTPTNNGVNTFNFTNALGTNSILSVDTLNKRVGIGTTSPMSLQTIALADGGAISSNNPMLTVSHTANAAYPYAGIQLNHFTTFGNQGGADISFANNGVTEGLIQFDSDLGIPNNFRIENQTATGPITFATNGASPTERMRITSGGNIGIGTTSPAGRLSINTPGSGSGQAFIVDTSTASDGRYSFVVQDNGNVGIGVRNPSQALQLGNWSGNFTPKLELDYSYATYGSTYAGTLFHAGNSAGVQGTGGLQIQSIGNSSIVFSNGTTVRQIIDQNGNVGIGTTSPDRPLTVVSATGASQNPWFASQANLYDSRAMAAGVGGTLQFSGAYTSNNAEALFAWIRGSKVTGGSGDYSGNLILGARNGSVIFDTESNPTIDNPAVSMILTNTGNVGIGTTTPNAKLEIAGRADLNAPPAIQFSDTSGNGNSRQWSIANGAVNGAANYGYFSINESTNSGSNPSVSRMAIDYNGNVGIGTTSPFADLSVAGASNGTNALFAVSSSTASATSTAFIIDKNGNVGIGYASPQAYIDTMLDAGGAIPSLRLRQSNVPAVRYWDETLAMSGGSAAIQYSVTNSGVPSYSFFIPQQGGAGVGQWSTITAAQAANPDLFTIVSTSTLNTVQNGITLADLSTKRLLLQMTSSSTPLANSDAVQLLHLGGSGDLGLTSRGTAASNIRFFTSAGSALAEQMRITSSGSVGIGTTSPMAKLSVGGLGGGSQYINIQNSVAAYPYTSGAVLELTDYYGLHPRAIGIDNGGKYFIERSGIATPDMVIDQGGNVGIGTTSPTALLSLDTTAGYQLKWARGVAGANQWGISTDASGTYINDVSAATVPFTILNGGNVGIGTTSPGATLDVNGSINLSGTGTNIIEWPYIGNSSVAGLEWFRGGSYGSFLGAATSSGDLVFYDSSSSLPGTERFRIGRSSGNVTVQGAFSVNNITLGTSVTAATSSIVSNTYNGQKIDAITLKTFSGTGDSQYPRLTVTTGTAGSPGTADVRVDNANLIVSGNVGIGTANPGSDVGMTGGLTINGTNGTQVTVQRNGTSGFALNISGNTAGDWTMYDKVGGTWNASITSKSGNVGIGTTTPSEKLTINGKIAFVQSAGDEINAGKIDYRSFDSGALSIVGAGASGTRGIRLFDTVGIGYSPSTNSSNVLLVNGNVGIGTTSPDRPLTVVSATGASQNPWFASQANLYDSRAMAAGVGGTLQFSGAYTSNNAEALFAWIRGSKVTGGSGDYSGNLILGARNGSVIFDTESNPTIDNPAVSMILTNTGNVGIGTVSPSMYTPYGYTLDIRGTSSDQNYGGSIRLASNNGATTNSAISVSTNGLDLFNTLAAPVRLGTNGTERMRVDSGGNVGVGSSTPWAQLSVNPNGVAGPAFAIGSSTATNFVVLNNGNVGIGTTSPAYKLSVSGAGAVRNEIIGTDAGSTAGLFLRSNGNSGGSTIRDNNKDLEFFTSASGQVVTIKDNGNVGIGTTTPSEKLTINGKIAFVQSAGDEINAGKIDYRSFDSGALSIVGAGASGTRGIRLFDTVGIGYSPSTNSSNVLLVNGNVGIGTTSPDLLLSVGSATPVGSVAHFENSTGSCYINPTTTSLSCTSDARLKTNVLPVTVAAMSGLLKLDPVTFNWTAEAPGSQSHTGFIAQQVQPYFPDLITQAPDGYLTMNYAGLTPYLVKAYQDLAAQTASTSAKMADISGALEALCVTGDTKLRVRRRKGNRLNASGNIDTDDYDYLEIPIADVQAGDEVLSLNEGTGTLEYRRVHAVVATGMQEVFEIVTASGRRIRTTATHPYLVLPGLSGRAST